jgi:Fe-S cluster biogenesis protein NfuA
MITYSLSVSKTGNGLGTITSSPSGISCGSDCSESYNYGTSVTLTASPSTGSTFTGWSGACSGTGTCTMSMTSNKSATANFNLITYSLSVSKNGSGTITSSPSGISCGSDCSESYNYGTSVTLTASPSSNYIFTGWSGACSGTVTCTMSMTSSKSATASFVIANQSPNASMSCNDSGCGGIGILCHLLPEWIIYRPTADPTPCVYTIDNNSTDPDGSSDIIKSEWFIKKQSESSSSYVLKSSCVLCDYTFQDMQAGSYNIKLRVEDTLGHSDYEEHAFVMRDDIFSNFECSLDNVTWSSCDSFTATENEVVYFKDASIPSTGASIVSRSWTKNGVQFSSSSTGSTTIGKTDNLIRLTVTDSRGRADYSERSLLVRMSLPDWQEIAPF